MVEISQEDFWRSGSKLSVLEVEFGFASGFLWLRVWSELGSASASEDDRCDGGVDHLSILAMRLMD